MICRRDRAGKPIQLNDDERFYLRKKLTFDLEAFANVAISDRLQRRLELESHSGR
jgi:hypothetical protein